MPAQIIIIIGHSHILCDIIFTYSLSSVSSVYVIIRYIICTVIIYHTFGNVNHEYYYSVYISLGCSHRCWYTIMQYTSFVGPVIVRCGPTQECK